MIFDRIRNPYLRHATGMLAVGVMIYALFQGFGHYYVEGVGYATIQDVLIGGLAVGHKLKCTPPGLTCWRRLNPDTQADRPGQASSAPQQAQRQTEA